MCFHPQSSVRTAKDMNDEWEFGVVKRALDTVGISGPLQQDLFRILAGLLHIGNMEMVDETTGEGDVARVSNQQTLRVCSFFMNKTEYHKLWRFLLIGFSINQLFFFFTGYRRVIGYFT